MQGSQTFVSHNSGLGSNKEESEVTTSVKLLPAARWSAVHPLVVRVRLRPSEVGAFILQIMAHRALYHSPQGSRTFYDL